MSDFLDRVRALARARTYDDPAHDWSHVARVARSAEALAREAGADVTIAVSAALLHELFNYPKGHPESHRSGEVCAEHARLALRALGATGDVVEAVAEAIRTHPFSLGEMPKTLEGKVLQDADRLDALGAIGAARCFATCHAMGRPFYHPDDPFCRDRAPDDKLWGVDHFYRKLLKLGDTLHTDAAKREAARRTAFLKAFLAELEHEVGAGSP